MEGGGEGGACRASGAHLVALARSRRHSWRGSAVAGATTPGVYPAAPTTRWQTAHTAYGPEAERFISESKWGPGSVLRDTQLDLDPPRCPVRI